MLIYTIDRTLDGVLSAVFDAFSLHQQPDALVGKGEPLPLFCDEVHEVMTADDRAQASVGRIGEAGVEGGNEVDGSEFLVGNA